LANGIRRKDHNLTDQSPFCGDRHRDSPKLLRLSNFSEVALRKWRTAPNPDSYM
jgi:hypothetical protein